MMEFTPEEKEALLIALEVAFGMVNSSWEHNDSGLSDEELTELWKELKK